MDVVAEEIDWAFIGHCWRTIAGSGLVKAEVVDVAGVDFEA